MYVMLYIEEIKKKKDALQEKAMAMGAKMYENVNSENANEAQADQTTSENDNVSEADYEEK